MDMDLFFPGSYGRSRAPQLSREGLLALDELMPGGDLPRVPGWTPGQYEHLVAAYGRLPMEATCEPVKLVRQMTQDLLSGAVNWRCPDLQYNLGAPVNVVAAALYALALEVNVYLINDGLAGSAVAAETSVAQILATLAGLPTGRAHGAFVFGGTGTMAYAIKAGLRKAAPDSARSSPNNVKLLVTEDAHFSHLTAADWLGVGSDDLLTVGAAHDRRSRLDDAERQLRRVLDEGGRPATILINGGTTYDHAVDDITAFADLRDRLVTEYGLPYRPHLHVDSVVGWAWLMFNGYDYQENPADISSDALALIGQQYERISKLHLADSWGVDFHKGVGSCPIDSSVIMFNDRTDFVRLAKGGGAAATTMHQLAADFSAESPADYTLETSRSGGKALGALASLHSLGQRGYQMLLGNLMQNTVVLRAEVAAAPDMRVLNPHALGYQTMVRLYPPGTAHDPRCARELTQGDGGIASFIEHGNLYLKQFFAWDNATRMDVNGGGVVYSFSRKYVRTPSGVDISGLKFYPTSPRTGVAHMREAVRLLAARKRQFDLGWQAKGR